MTETTNLHLKKPDANDYYCVDDQNHNMDVLDAAVAGLAPTPIVVGGAEPEGGPAFWFNTEYKTR